MRTGREGPRPWLGSSLRNLLLHARSRRNEDQEQASESHAVCLRRIARCGVFEWLVDLCWNPGVGR